MGKSLMTLPDSALFTIFAALPADDQARMSVTSRDARTFIANHRSLELHVARLNQDLDTFAARGQHASRDGAAIERIAASHRDTLRAVRALDLRGQPSQGQLIAAFSPYLERLERLQLGNRASFLDAVASRPAGIRSRSFFRWHDGGHAIDEASSLPALRHLTISFVCLVDLPPSLFAARSLRCVDVADTDWGRPEQCPKTLSRRFDLVINDESAGHTPLGRNDSAYLRLHNRASRFPAAMRSLEVLSLQERIEATRRDMEFKAYFQGRGNDL